MNLEAKTMMCRHVVSARPNDTVAAAARLMAANDISALPVCDANGAPIGMISEGDLLYPFGQQQGFRRSWWLHLLTEGNRPVRALSEYLHKDQRRVCELMTKPVITVTVDTSVDSIVALLLRYRIKRVPVVEDGRIVGIVSRADVIRALAERPNCLSEEWKSVRRGGDNPLGRFSDRIGAVVPPRQISP